MHFLSTAYFVHQLNYFLIGLRVRVDVRSTLQKKVELVLGLRLGLMYEVRSTLKKKVKLVLGLRLGLMPVR